MVREQPSAAGYRAGHHFCTAAAWSRSSGTEPATTRPSSSTNTFTSAVDKSRPPWTGTVACSSRAVASDAGPAVPAGNSTTESQPEPVTAGLRALSLAAGAVAFPASFPCLCSFTGISSTVAPGGGLNVKTDASGAPRVRLV